VSFCLNVVVCVGKGKYASISSLILVFTKNTNLGGGQILGSSRMFLTVLKTGHLSSFCLSSNLSKV